MIGSLALLAILLGGLLYVVGAHSLAKRLLLFGVLLGLFAGLLEENLGRVRSSVDGKSFGPLVGVGVAVLVFVGYLRYRSHKAKLAKWLPKKPTSLKRRVERD